MTLAALSWIVASPVQAQYLQISVWGQPITCKASNGQQVLFFDNPAAADAARQLGGARADWTPQYGYTIALDPQYMNSLPRLGALFVVYHECAHVALPFGVGLGSPTQELAADCHAIRFMRAHGLINNWTDFEQAMTAIYVAGGAHAANRQRTARMAAC